MSLLLLAFSLINPANATGFCEVNDPGSAAFIRNSYVELGLGPEGAFGEGGYPAEWHYRSNSGQLGFVANPQANGWASYYGDFFSPGSPLEGWGVEVDGTSYTNFNGSQSIMGSLGDPACNVDICGNLGGAVTWSGALGNLGAEIQYGVVNDGVYIVMTVTLRNNGSSTLSDVYWFRNVDPDNSVMTGHGYSTTNTIISQPNEVTNLAEVKATGGDGADLYLLASDSRARVTHGGFYNGDGSNIWSGAGFDAAVGSSATDDAAISFALRVGDMAPGQVETFRVIYALDDTAIDAATECAEAPVDADGDGVSDPVDACPADPLNDADGDGVCGNVDACPDFNDSIDEDLDLVPDACDACPLDPLNDSDADGACAEVDLCPGFDDSADIDGDATPDACDTCPVDALNDSDADGSCDSNDICPGADDTLDTDGDLVPNGCDDCPVDTTDDSDGDGSCDSADICPGFNDSDDVDGDGLADECDPCPFDEMNDIDGDSVCADVDTCPNDSLDDRDGDGLCESVDPCPVDPLNDRDGDGSCDSLDICFLDPLNDIDGDGACGDVDACPTDSQNDTDGDGLCESVDPCPADLENDTDGDGSCDSVDSCQGFDDAVDEDGDGVPNGCDTCPVDEQDDADGDGTCDSSDLCPDANDNDDMDLDLVPDVCDICPLDPFNDSDEDGICDDEDSCLDDPTNDADADTICGVVDNCPDYPNDEQLDFDGDGYGDFCDADADGDGFADSGDNCIGIPNDQTDVDGDTMGDACDPIDNRPVPGDTGDTGVSNTETHTSTSTPTATATATETGTMTETATSTGTSTETGTSTITATETRTETDTGTSFCDDTDTDVVDDEETNIYVPGKGCSTSGSGPLLLLTVVGAMAVLRRARRVALVATVPLMMGASGGQVPEMSVVPLPTRGASLFKGVESSFSGGVVTNPLSYRDARGNEEIVIGNTFWGWETTRWTTDHVSLDFGIPLILTDDGTTTGDVWAGARLNGKPFDGEGFGLYGDAYAVVPTGTGLGVAWPGRVLSGELGAELQKGGVLVSGGVGYLSRPEINLEGYRLSSGPFATAALGYLHDNFMVKLAAQGAHNPGQDPISSLSAGPSIDLYAGTLGVGLAVSKGIIRQPGDPGWNVSLSLTAGKGKDDEAPVAVATVTPPTPQPVVVPPPAPAKCDHQDRIVISPAASESPIVVVVQNIETQAGQKAVSAPKKEPGIGFRSGDSALNDKSKITLDGVFTVLQIRPAFGVKVIGYADPSEAGGKDLGALSVERAKAAADYLISRGIDPKRITVLGGADGKPIDTSGTPEGNALNRRVEFVVVTATELIK